jgi:tetratricopeptide (TPR) repeat protein
MLIGDPERATGMAAEVRSPYFRAVLDNLREHGKAPQLVLEHRPVLQKHATCLPASVATVLGAFAIQLDEDAMAAALTYDGTAIWRAASWLEGQGFATRTFVAKPELARALIGNGVPFVLSFEDWGAAHATAAVGLDEASGTLILHDPSAERWARVLLDRLTEGETPFGPLALAVVPRQWAAMIESIPAASCIGCAAFLRFQAALETAGSGAASTVVSELAQEQPDSPFGRRMRAILHGIRGDTPAALTLQHALIADHPDCMSVRRDLLSTLYRARDTAQLRTALTSVIERGVLPGSSAKQDWILPPPILVAQYADFVGLEHQGARRAERLLRTTIRQAPGCVDLFHILGDILLRTERNSEAALPLRIAASLESTNEHYARSAADALRMSGQEEVGLALLRRRVEQLGTLIKGGQPWATLAGALEEYGYPDEALAVVDQAVRARPDDAELASFAVEFWVRMGRWQEAEAGLERVRLAARSASYHSAQVQLLLAAGRWHEAIAPAQAWLAETPDDPTACRHYLDLLARRDGRQVALEQARAWVDQHPGNEDFELLLYEELTALSLHDQALALIRARAARNPFDIWAWREIGHALVTELGRRAAARGALLEELDTVLARCRKLNPDSAPTLILAARVAEAHGDRELAADLHLRALDADPEGEICFTRVCELAESFSESQRQELLVELENRLLRTVGHLHCARPLALAIASNSGVRAAEEWVSRWRARRPADPEVLEAQVDLWLYRGEGRSDAARAVELLKREAERYPHHTDLRLSLAQAHAILGHLDEERTVLEGILLRQPRVVAARTNLARLLLRQNAADAALKLLEQGVACDPLAGPAWQALAELQWDLGQHQAATDTLACAVARLPENLTLRDQLIGRLLELGDSDAAVAVARTAVELYPEGAYCRVLLARALSGSEGHTNVEEIELTLRRALELNWELYEAGDLLAELLASQQRPAEARAVLDQIQPSLDDPAPARGRRAWITWQEGRHLDAIDEMVQVVRDSPRYGWGWWNLMGWLETEKAWERVRAVLAEVPPALLGDPSFRAHRLELLSLAGVAADALDPQWDKLLDDFPEDTDVRLRRFDLLAQAGAWEHAATVLTALDGLVPQPTWVMARRVQLLVEQRDAEQALGLACELWQRPGDDEVWPEETAWRALDRAGKGAAAARTVIELTSSGQRVRRRAFDLALEEIASRPQRDGGSRVLKRRAVRMLDELLGKLGEDDGNGGQRIAAVLEALEQAGQRAHALRYWRTNQARCRQLTSLWAKIGYLLANAGPTHAGKLRRWLADWREHADAPAWALANYTVALRKGHPLWPGIAVRHLDEILAASTHALVRVRRDQTTRFHACVVGETLLRLGRDTELREHMARWGGLIADGSDHWWLPRSLGWAPNVLPLVVELLEFTSAEHALNLRYQLGAVIDRSVPAWVMRAWSRQLARLVPRGRRWLTMTGLHLRRLLTEPAPG